MKNLSISLRVVFYKDEVDFITIDETETREHVESQADRGSRFAYA